MNDITDYKQVKLTDDHIKTIRAMFDRDSRLSDTQIQIFLMICKKKGLDPFEKQICCTPYFNKRANRYDMVTIVQIDGLRAIAERSGAYAPGRATEFTYNKDGYLESATAYVKKMTKDGTWHEVASTARYKEYTTTKGLWVEKAHIMLSKCAEAMALRRAFPVAMSGLYTSEEFDQAVEDSVSQDEENDNKLDSNAPVLEAKATKGDNSEDVEKITTQQVNYILDIRKRDTNIDNALGQYFRSKGIESYLDVPAECWDEIICKIAEAKTQNKGGE